LIDGADVIAERPRMSGIWAFFGSKKNRESLAWLGGGLAAAVIVLWTAYVYFHPPKVGASQGGGDASASHGAASVGGNVTHSTIKTSPDAGGESQPQGY
jgi:hypothetical protein